MKLFVEKKVSKKSENEYTGLYVDLGYRTIAITMDTATIAEVADMTIRQLNELETNKPILIGEIIQKLK